MKLRVIHFPQVPCNPFIVNIKNIEEGLLILDVLADYDLFQYENKIKPDYTNMTSLEEFDEEEKDWFTWEDENGYDIDHYELKNGKAVLKEDE